MDLDTLRWWKFTGELTEGCELKCPDCGEFSPHTMWVESEVPCECCGEHFAMDCPKCHGLIDHIHQFEPVEVRPYVPLIDRPSYLY